MTHIEAAEEASFRSSPAPSFPIGLLDDAIVAHMEAVDVEAVEDYPLSQRSCLSDISGQSWN
ncbi:hypothetical protein PRIPAC_75420 [Pristionchus pacificus]|uniref:Uncharacterized protein n=1 Tax=Pristionchus pacificus TaxID=54126 RepID=A0A454XHY8_PRIPA|nr:hypothetical protein PRIPAC_75420 [Pristionchus pacificus]|eukprot:PDM73304.1 hypothetical protein PRIPAC_40660 [Pristionchus pacificus]